MYPRVAGQSNLCLEVEIADVAGVRGCCLGMEGKFLSGSSLHNGRFKPGSFFVSGRRTFFPPNDVAQHVIVVGNHVIAVASHLKEI